jgi:hypothetical protein
MACRLVFGQHERAGLLPCPALGGTLPVYAVRAPARGRGRPRADVAFAAACHCLVLPEITSTWIITPRNPQVVITITGAVTAVAHDAPNCHPAVH